MNTNPTLTSEEFKNIHNSLCELRSVRDQLEPAIHPSMTTKLNKVIDTFETALANAYATEDNDFSKKQNHYTEQQMIHNLTDSVWSVYEVSNLNAPHPYTGAGVLSYNDHWGGKTVVVPILGTTWMDLWIAADHAIVLSTDLHHIFIEGFTQAQDGVLTLSTGS